MNTMAKTGLKSIVMVAGEASGDMHGAHVVRALRQRHEDIYICGIGSQAMAAAGAEVMIDASQLAVVGITEVLAKAPSLLKARTQLKRLLVSLRPNLLILIDFPDFNLHLAAAAKKLAIPVLYYISPQIWAWRSNRVKKIRRRVDHMAVILPFEEIFYQKHGVPVSFVGHPLLDAPTEPTRPHANKWKPMQGLPPLIGLLPGSRDREVARLLPTMLQAAQLLQKKIDGIRFLVSCAASIDQASIQNIIAQQPLQDVQIFTGPVGDLFKECNLAIAASGTVTLEAAIHETPMIITYAVSPITYWLGKILVEVEHIGLANLIANQRIVPELVQDEVTAESIAEKAIKLLSDVTAYDKMCSDLKMVRNRLGQAGASQRVAQIACSLMGCDHAI